MCDFIVEVEEGKDCVVLQLTDTQIIDASQARTNDRLGPSEKLYWAKNKVKYRCYNYVKKTIEETKPDLILITGDLVYGEFDDDGSCLVSLLEFLDGFDIPYAPIFGNHDNASHRGVEWQCEQLENAKNCLFKRNELTGNGNYTVGIKQGDKIKRVFIMLDSHNCLIPAGIYDDQIDWYTDVIQKIKEKEPQVKISFAMHIQPFVFKDAFAKYGFDNFADDFKPINIDAVKNKSETDFGYIGAGLKTIFDENYKVFESIKNLGADSIFVGHQHPNSGSVVYEGIRFQYGQKSSTYDRANYVTEKGDIVCSFLPAGMPIVGGSVFSVSKDDGSIVSPHIYLYHNIQEHKKVFIKGTQN